MTDDQVPFAVSLGVAVLLVGTGLLVSQVTRRAADGRLGPNPLAGIRTRATLASGRAWRAGHAAAVGRSDAAGVAFALTGLGALPWRDGAAFGAGVLLGTAVAAGLLLDGVRLAARAARAAEEQTR